MIVLLGYMGCGKSTSGKILASETGMQFIDFDQFIEEKEGRSIPEIFSEKGEVYFRKKEHTYLKELLESMPEAVISLGGGTPCFGNNMQILLDSAAKVVYLKAGIDTLAERLSTQKEARPLIKDIPDEELEEFIRKHLFERNFFYLQAPLKVAVDGLTAAQVAQKIQEII